MVKRFLFSVALVLTTVLAVHAEELTVNDGATTNSYAPMYGLYADTQGAHSQSIFSAESLADMANGSITKMTFYTSNTSVSWSGSFAFKLIEVSEDNLSSGFVNTASATTVYAGGLSVSNSKLEVVFDEAFNYGGGNLLVEWVCTSAGSYSGANFYGKSATSGSTRYATSSGGAGSSQSFAPKTTFEYTPGAAPTCAKPGKPASDKVSSDEATLTWGASASTGDYQYLCVVSGAEADWTVAEMVSDTTVTVGGLNPNTKYDFYVRAYCGDSDQSTALKCSFKTDCAAVTPEALGKIGFETSEGYVSGGGNLANCWTVGSLESTSSTYIPYIQANGYTTYTSFGSQCLYLYALSSSYTSADGAYAILPQIDFKGNLQGYHMTFQLRKYSTSTSYSDYNDTLYVAVVEDPSDMSKMEVIGYATSTSTSYGKVDVNFANSSIADGYIVLLAKVNQQATTSSKYAGFYVDELEIKQSKNCATPTELAMSNLSVTSVDLSWNGNAGAYNVCVSSASVNPDTVQNWLRVENASAVPFTLDNLSPATTYYVYIQGVCGAGDESDFSNEIVFTTECNSVTSFPWSENFEAYSYGTFAATCWSNTHISGSGSSTFSISTSAQGGNSTHTCNLPDQSSGTITRLSLPAMDIPAANSYLFSIDVYRNATSSSYDAEGLRIFADNTELGFISRKYDVTDGNNVPAEATSAWYTYEFVIPAAGVQHIIIQGENKYGSATYFDNLVVKEAPACIKVSNIHYVAGSATQNEAVVAWDPATVAPNYAVVVKNGEDTIVNTTVDQAEYVLTNLNHSTTYNYTVLVKALCSATDESEEASANISFSTECAAITELPWSEGFESMAKGSSSSAAPLCWDMINCNENGAYPYMFVNNTSAYVHSGNKSLYFQSGKARQAIAILPEMDVEFKGNEIKFWYRNEGTGAANGTLSVGYITDITDSTSFVALAELEQTTTMTEVMQSLSDVPAGARLAFSYMGGTTQNYYAGIDDILIHEATTCFKPSGIHAIDSLSTISSGVIAWSAPKEGGDQFRLIVKNGETELFNGLVADTFFVVDNLASSTLYSLAVTLNTVCGDDDESEAIQATAKFSTLCDVVTEFPWSNDFEAYASATTAANLPCFHGYAIQGTAKEWCVSNSSSNAHSGSQYMSISYSSSSLGRTVAAMELPDMLFDEGVLYEINYFLKGSANSSTDTMRVFIGETVLHELNCNYDLGANWVEFNDTIVGTGETINIGFSWSNLDGYFGYLDDVTVTKLEKGPVTSLDLNATEIKAVKIVRNGQVYILRGGVMYDITGRKVK